jgi:protease I
MSIKSLLITWEGFQDHEVVYPYYRLLEEASSTNDVRVYANKLGRINGILGCHVVCSHETNLFKDHGHNEKLIEEFDLLVLPGGVKALEKLRQEKAIISFIQNWGGAGKLIASTCSGAQLLISAKLVKGLKVSGYYSMQDDLENAGAIYTKEPVTTSANIISSPHYDFMADWMKEAISVVEKNQNEKNY